MNSGSAATFLAFLGAGALKATVFLGFAWLAAYAARNRSASLRHRIWAVAILASVALPLFMITLPAWHSATISVATGKLWNAPHAGAALEGRADLPAMILNAVIAAPVQTAWPAALFLVWLLGCSPLALRMAVGLTRLAAISARAEPLVSSDWRNTAAQIAGQFGITRPLQLLQYAEQTTMPLTWGVLRPVILLPSGAVRWPEQRRRMVLTHELAHVARRDWLYQMAAETVRTIYWFHPLAWVAARRLRQESECACDDAVLEAGIPAPNYAQQLLQLAGTLSHPDRAWPSALALARRSHLERRFSAMLNLSLDRGALSPRSRVLTLLCGLLLMLPLATLRLPAQNAASFSGAIFDPSGAAVANATVILTGNKTHKTEMTATDSQGQFRFNALPPGDYHFRAIKRGFEDYKSEQVLRAGQEQAQNFTLNIAAVAYAEEVIAKGTAKGVPPNEPGGKTTGVRVGGDIQASKLITKVQPVYPEKAKAAGSQGTVVLHAIIGTDGSPMSLGVVNDKIDPELARASIESVSKWHYTPTLLNGQPMEVETTIEVHFTLQR
jgi:TonB family protein